VTSVLGDLHQQLGPFYSDIGRPSIDPELLIRMLIVRLVGLPLASNSVSVSGAPQRPPRTVDHNVSVILNNQVRSRMPMGAR
jgi:hypothetical protein